MARRATFLFSAFTAAALLLTGCAQTSISTEGPLIRLGSQGIAGETAMGMPAKDMLWYPVEYTYLAGASLNLDGEQGRVYKVVPTGDPTKVIAKVATAFGVTGKVEKIEELAPEPPMPMADGSTALSDVPASRTNVHYHVGSKDWSGPSVQLYWSGTGNWSYNNPQAYGTPGAPSVGCAYPDAKPSVGQSSPGQSTTGVATATPAAPSDATLPRPADCVYEPQLPKNLPSKDEARAQAARLFTATGMPVSADEITVRADDWGVFATAELKVAGQPVAIEWTMSWADGGVISYASGHAVSVVDVGSFSTVSDRDAVKRVGDWRWYGSPASSWYPDFGFGGPVMMDRGAMASGSGSVSSGTATASPGTVTAPTQAPPAPTMEPMPTEAPVDPGQPTEPKKVTVTLEKSARALVAIFDRDGQMWLVPGYVFEDGSQGVYAVIALVEGVIEMPEAGPMLR